MPPRLRDIPGYPNDQVVLSSADLLSPNQIDHIHAAARDLRNGLPVTASDELAKAVAYLAKAWTVHDPSTGDALANPPTAEVINRYLRLEGPNPVKAIAMLIADDAQVALLGSGLELREVIRRLARLADWRRWWT